MCLFRVMSDVMRALPPAEVHHPAARLSLALFSMDLPESTVDHGSKKIPLQNGGL